MITCWATQGGVAVGIKPILTCLGGTVVMGEIDQFEPHSLKFAASDETLILSLAPWTLLEIQQDGLGAIQYGYVVNPVKQITEQDEHTITLELWQLPLECTWRRVRGYVQDGLLSAVATQLMEVAPGWLGQYVISDPSQDFSVSVTFPSNPTVQNAFISTATKFGQWSRLGRDPVTNLPIRKLEMGNFSALPTVFIQDAKGADPIEVMTNPYVAIVAAIEEQPADVRQTYNVCVPTGNGNDAASLVTLERCWRIINDPAYVNYNRYGSDADSIARTGLPSVFTEYDPNYPISDPENPPTGQPLLGYLWPDGSVTYMNPSAQYPLATLLALGWRISQGAIGTRGISRNGQPDYIVYDKVSYLANGFREGQYIDSTLDYQDQSVLNQELTSRALYVSIITQFKRYGHPHHLITCTVPGLGWPVREGDLVSVDFQRSSNDPDDGHVILESNILENQRVMKVERVFNGEDTPMDVYTTSNLGRFDSDDGSLAADAANQMVAVQLRQGTSFAPMFFGPFADNLDAVTPIRLPVTIPASLYSWGRCTLRFEFQEFTQSGTTAYSDPNVPVSLISSPQDILLDTPSDLLLGGTFDANGNLVGSTDGFSTGLYVHLYATNALGSAVGAGNFPQSGGNAALGSPSLPGNNDMDITVSRRTGGVGPGLDTATTKSATRTPLAQTVAKKFSIIARIAGTTVLGLLTPHTHLLEKKVGKGPQPVGIILSINGINISSEVTLVSGSRDGAGVFTSSAEIYDIGPYIQYPGQTLIFEFDSQTNASNTTGAGRLLISGTWFGQFGGLASVVQAL